MKKEIKHPIDMTTDEAIVHVFHPEALKHLKKHIETISKGKKKADKKVYK